MKDIKIPEKEDNPKKKEDFLVISIIISLFMSLFIFGIITFKFYF